jgi:hypothetical protein
MLEGRRGAALGLALLLGLGVFGIGHEFSSPKPPIKQTSDIYDPCKQADEKSIERCTNVRIANYTFCLALFTGLLALVGSAQIGFLIRADKTASTAADAAKTAAEAALAALDRPWIYINTPEVIKIRVSPNKEQIFATFSITNYGKAPAVLLSAKAILFYSPGPFLKDQFPVRPLPDTMKDFPTSSQVAIFTHTVGKDMGIMDGPNFRKINIGNGIVVPPVGKPSASYAFIGDTIVTIPDNGIPIEFSANIYLIGRMIYASPDEESEVISFCYEGINGPLKAVYGAPYNDRRKIQRAKKNAGLSEPA